MRQGLQVGQGAMTLGLPEDVDSRLRMPRMSQHHSKQKSYTNVPGIMIIPEGQHCENSINIMESPDFPGLGMCQRYRNELSGN